MSIIEPHTETTDKLKYIFDHAKVGIAICNAEDNTLEMVNPAFARIHGYEPHELIGVSPGEVFAPECILRLETHESAPSCAIDDISFETTHVKKDGSLVPVSVHITVIKDEDGVVKQRIANIQDISDRKKSENTLQESNERYTQILNNSIDVIYMVEVTPERRFIYLDVNAAYAEVTGIAREEVIGLSVDKIENETFRSILIDKFTCCLNAGEKTDYIADYPFPSGRRTFHSILSPMFDENGHIVRIVGAARDITDAKKNEERLYKSEEAFRTLAENYPDIIIRYDRACRRTYVNPAFEKMSGYKTDELLGKTPAENSPLIAPQYYMTELTKVIESGTPSDLEIAVYRPSGEMGWYITSLVPEFDTLNVISVLCVARDITHAKHYESMLQKSAVLEKTLSRMAANLPGFVYTLRRTPEGDASFPYASSGIFTLFGLHPENVSEDITPLQTLIHMDDRPPIEEAIALSASEMTPCAVTFRVQIPGQQERWIEARATPKREMDGSGAILWHGVMLDVTERIQEQRQLAMLNHFLDHIKEEIFVVGENGRFLYVNQEACRVLGYTHDELLRLGVPDLDPDYPMEQWEEHWMDLKTNGARTFETFHTTKDRRIVPIEVHANYFAFGDTGYNMAIVHDITERKEIETRLKRKEASLREAQQIAKIGSWELTFPEQTLHWSDEIYRIFEIEPTDQLPSYADFIDAIHPEDRELVDAAYRESLKNRTPYEAIHRLLLDKGRIKYVHEKGVTYYDSHGNPLRSIGTVQDITKQKSIEKKIEHMAHHDPLTGLPNRTLAKYRAEQIITHAKRTETQASFLFIDLDGFKAINDTLGHSAGDAMLKTVASRLQESVRESDTISRLGGDEFLLILCDIKELNDVVAIAEKLLKKLEKPLSINNHPLSLSASIGIALYPSHGDTFESLLQNADTAMYKAKESGKNGYCLYTRQMNQDLLGQLKIQNDLKNALHNNEFIVHYQPQIDLAINRITGVEALIRWRHPQLGMIPPMDFIPIAESSGLIVQIGEWVIQEACAQAALWHKQGIEITVAVNISAVQFKRGNFKTVVEKALSRSGIKAKLLELELTESIMMHNAETMLQTVLSLKELGVQLSIDDFGTGYSSLAYLKRFAVDKLKIDQSFVRDIQTNQDDAVIVQTIIQMAKNLNLKSIAEGVENEEVLTLLTTYGCDEVQGYHFAKPMEAAEFETYYQNF